MREIKFRQAVYVNDKFHHWHYWGFLSDLSFVGPDRTNGLAHALDNSQQSTGLPDKNEKDIYNDDIIKTFDAIKLERGEQADYVGVVAWSTRSLAWVITDKNGKFIELLCRVEQPEIIGNIHTENKNDPS